MYAIVEAGGHQYKVSPGDTIEVEKLPHAVGDSVELERVLLVGDGERVAVGQPTVSGAKVIATVADQFRDKKIIVFKYKAKSRYRRKQGHRQNLTRLTINEIVL